MPQSKILTIPEVAKILGISESTVYAYSNPYGARYREDFPEIVGIARLGKAGKTVIKLFSRVEIENFKKKLDKEKAKHSGRWVQRKRKNLFEKRQAAKDRLESKIISLDQHLNRVRKNEF